jgi:hypothetical protein
LKNADSQRVTGMAMTKPIALDHVGRKRERTEYQKGSAFGQHFLTSGDQSALSTRNHGRTSPLDTMVAAQRTVGGGERFRTRGPLMSDHAHRTRRIVTTSLGSVIGIALAIGWYVDRSRLSQALDKAASERAAALEELRAAPAAIPETAHAETALRQVGQGPAPTDPEETATELASLRTELNSARTELSATKQALSDSDDTRIEVGKKLQDCQASLNQHAAAK